MAVTIDITANTSQATQAATQLSANLSAAFAGVQTQLNQMATASGRSSSAIVQGLTAITPASKAAAQSTATMAADMQKSLKSVEQAQKSTVNGFTLMQGAIRQTAALLATIGVSVGLTGLAKNMVDTAATFETLDVRLRFLTNSLDDFNRAKQFILEFAQTTPLQLDEVSDAFVRLTASGFDAASMMPTLVDAVSQFGGGNESLQALIRNFQQMSSQAKVSGQELRDIADRTLIPALQIVTEEARKMGIHVKDSLAEAGISGPKAIELFMKGAQERFKGATAILATTWTQLVSNLIDQWKIFSDTVIRESGFLNFMKAAAFELFQLMSTLIKGNKNEFVSWGDTAVASMRKASLAVASLLDLLNGVLQLGARVQAQFADWERQGTETMANLYNSVAQFFGFTGTFTAKVQADVGQATGAIAAAITSGEITAAVDRTFDRLQQRAEEFRKIQEGIVGKAPAFPPPPPAVDTGASKAAANRLKAEEDQLKASLKRQEALIESSYDERRQLIDAQASEALVKDVTNVKAIAHARTQALRTAAIEEARDLEHVRLESVDRQLVVSKAQLKAEIAAHADKPEQIAKYEAALTTVVDEAEAERAKIRKHTSEVEQQNSKKTLDAQIKSAEELVKLTTEMEQDKLKAKVDLVDEQIALIEAQVDGEVLTQAQGMQRIHALQNQRLDNTADLYRREADDAIAKIDLEVQETELGQAQILKIHEDLEIKLEALGVHRATQHQEQLNELLEDWRKWVKDVQHALGNFLFRWMDGQIKSIKDVLLDLKSYFFKIIADMVAYAATKQIIIPIVAAVLGGLGGGTGGVLDTIMKGFGLGNMVAGLAGAGGVGGAGGTGGASDHILQILGLGKMGLEFNNLFGSQGGITGAFHVLTDTVMGGVQSVADFVNALKFGTDITTESAINLSAAMDAAIPGTPLPGAGATGAGAITAGQVLGGVGGLAAIAGGIYGALNATNNASKAAFAASAAAGTAALASTALVAAGVIAATSGWTGIGLIAAGVTAILGTIAEMVIKPAGPSLSVRAGGGLNVGTADGQLQVQGDLGSRVTRREGVDRGRTQKVQQQLEEGITNAVLSIVQTINAVALDPAALAQPTQEALQKALKNLQPLNTANAKKMERDITEQLRFANLAIIGGLLEPVNMAFDQLRDQGDLQEQLDRLPGTTAGLVQVFKTLNQQLDEVAKSENTDVLRQLSAVRNQVENFGNRISGTAGQIAETIVTSIIDRFKTDVDTDFASQVTQFSDLLKSTFQSLAILRNTKETLEKAGLGGGAIGSQMDRLALAAERVAGQLSEQIVTGILDTLQETETHLDTTLAEQITTFSTLMTSSLQALGLLREVKGRLEGGGLGGGAVGGQIDRLAQATGEAAARISTQIVSTALSGLATNLNQVLIQPIRIQATTVNSLFNDSLAALNALWAQWHALEAAGIDITGIKDEFTRLVGGVIESALTVITQAFTRGSFAEFLAVLVSIPDDVAKLNPKLAELKALGVAFAQVVGPINQAIEMMEEDLRTTAERVTFTETRMSDLRDAIADAGNAADRALPLYAQLATAIQANGQAQIDSVNEVADAQIKAANEAADAQIKAVNEMADATKKAVNEWADAWTKAINDAADTQIALVNAWADDWTKAVNDAIDQQRTLLALWVEDMTNAVNTWADMANATAGQLRTVNETLLAEKSPAAQKAELLAEEGRLAAVVAGGGPGSSEAMTELIRVEQQLLALAKQSDDLKAQRDTLVKLEAMQKYLRDQLVALTGQSDPILAQIAIANTQKDHLKAIDDFNTKYGQYLTDVQAVYLKLIADEQALQLAAINVARDAQLQAVAVSRDFLLQAIDQLATAEITTMNNARDAQILAINTARDEMVKAIKVDVINQLKALEAALKTLFAGQDVVGGTLHVPVPVRMAQRGALIGFASGGMVPAMLEPREQVFTPPLGKGQQRALGAMNAAFPRFAGGGWTVPGRGSGDTVPMMLPSGSFVLNRNASGAMGYQNGGPVRGHSDGGSPPAVNIHIAKLEVRNDADIRAIIDGITRQLRREWRSPNDSGPFR